MMSPSSENRKLEVEYIFEVVKFEDWDEKKRENRETRKIENAKALP